MRCIRSTLLLLGLAGCAVGAVAQQTPPTNPPSGEADSIPQDRASEPAGALQSARSFEGKIVKLGDQFILKNAIAHTSYKLDDQKKAMHYAGKEGKGDSDHGFCFQHSSRHRYFGFQSEALTSRL